MTARKTAATIPSRADHLPFEHRVQAEFAMAAFATLKAGQVAYISVPITSGRRLYDYMDKNGFKTPAEAMADHDAFFEHVVKPNLAAGIAASETWDRKIDGIVLAPAEFEKRLRGNNIVNWGQDDFMGMWIRLIDEKITHMVMSDGWEYSNGAGEEYLQAALMQMGRGTRSDIKIVDVEGNDLTLGQGIALMAKAFIDVNKRGLRPRNMAETIGILLETEQRYNFEKQFGKSAEPHGGAVIANDTLPAYDRRDIVALGREVRAILDKHYPDIIPTLKKHASTDFTPGKALFRHEREKAEKAQAKVRVAR